MWVQPLMIKVGSSLLCLSVPRPHCRRFRTVFTSSFLFLFLSPPSFYPSLSLSPSPSFSSLSFLLSLTSHFPPLFLSPHFLPFLFSPLFYLPSPSPHLSSVSLSILRLLLFFLKADGGFGILSTPYLMLTNVKVI